jgi:hypothetical protein
VPPVFAIAIDAVLSVYNADPKEVNELPKPSKKLPLLAKVGEALIIGVFI